MNIILIFVLFYVFFVGITNRAEKALGNDSEFLSLEELKNIHPVQIKARDFAESFMNNRIKHEAEYYGQAIEIFGKVKNLYRRDEIFGYTNMRVLQVEGYKTDNYMDEQINLEFLFPSKRLKEFSELGIGDFVIFRAIYLGQFKSPFDGFRALAFVNPLFIGVDKTLAELSSLLRKGEAAYFSGQYEEAQSYAIEAYEIDPDNSDVLSLLGACEDAHHNYSSALEFFEKACRVNPDDPDNFYNKGRVYITVGKLDMARKSLAVMENRFPKHDYTKKLREAIKNNWVN